MVLLRFTLAESSSKPITDSALRGDNISCINKKSIFFFSLLFLLHFSSSPLLQQHSAVDRASPQLGGYKANEIRNHITNKNEAKAITCSQTAPPLPSPKCREFFRLSPSDPEAPERHRIRQTLSSPASSSASLCTPCTREKTLNWEQYTKEEEERRRIEPSYRALRVQFCFQGKNRWLRYIGQSTIPTRAGRAPESSLRLEMKSLSRFSPQTTTLQLQQRPFLARRPKSFALFLPTYPRNPWHRRHS